MKLESLDLSSLDTTASELETDKLPAPANPGFKCLRQVNPLVTPLEGTISTLISGTWFVSISDTILDIVDDFTKAESVEAVGVVDTEGIVKGILIREQLLKAVSRPYGRDLLSRQKLPQILTDVERFFWTENIFTVAERVRQTDRTVTYYVLQDEKEHFIGIFTSWDLVIFLSKLTREDINLAQKIQKSLIKEMHYHKEGEVEFAFSSLMAKGIGGDFIGIKKASSDRFIVSLCDVAGKGIAASLVSSTIAGMLEAFDGRKKLSDFLILLNQFMLRTFGSEKYATGIFLECNPEKYEITIFDLGHSHLAFYRKDKLATLPPPVTNPPLGILDTFKPTPYKVILQPGDVLLLFSDGLVEQISPTGSTYSYLRIKQYLNATATQSLPNCLIRFWEDFHAFRGNAPQVDDVTLFILRRLPNTQP
ncbi:MAG: SpoIIE family protein phosphatase [Spirochaetales bacterium]